MKREACQEVNPLFSCKCPFAKILIILFLFQEAICLLHQQGRNHSHRSSPSSFSFFFEEEDKKVILISSQNRKDLD